jgi:multiple sugar transport system substrate-binding protein
MKNSKLFVVLSVLPALGMLLAACAPAATPEATTAPAGEETTAAAPATEVAASEPVTITFWHAYSADTEAKFLDETLIPAFEAAHPNIKVQSVLVPYDQFRRKLLIALSGGEALIWPALISSGYQS